MRRRSVLSLALAFLAVARAGAQEIGTAEQRGLLLEQDEKYREAATAYREALAQAPASVMALLGLERVYAQLGWPDSLLPVLERSIAAAPREPALRAAQIRTLRAMGLSDRVHQAFDRWTRDMPGDPAPYREYARLLLQDGQLRTADSVLQRARTRLGTGRGLELEQAQLRAAMGEWALSAASWHQALERAPYLQQAAILSLVATPLEMRPAVRRDLLAAGRNVAARRVLAALELHWGAPQDAWAVLRDLPRDTATFSAWSEFVRRAEEAEAWVVVRSVLDAMLRDRPSADLALRAARAALHGDDAEAALSLVAQAERGLDSAEAAVVTLPMRLEALAGLGRAEEAQRTLDAYAPHSSPELRRRQRAVVAWAWVRAGDVVRARALLGSDTTAAASEVTGWLSLYSGDLAAARKTLRVRGRTTTELVTALALLARTKADASPDAGNAFLSLARGDTARAAVEFEEAANALDDARSFLIAVAARLHAAVRDDARAVMLWSELATKSADAPEAPEANLEWARALRRAGRHTDAVARLEHLILTYPNSALVPQARRELELARGAIPPAS
ncbi:MAG: tetratricopeptide repeat protein [Gemmatimonadaceae bacterium]